MTTSQTPAAPSPRVREVLDDLDRFYQDEVVPIEERLAREIGSVTTDQNGQLRNEVVEARAEIRRMAAGRGFYSLHLPLSIGGGGFTLEEMFFVEEAVYRRGLGLLKDALAWTEGPSPALLASSRQQRQIFVDPLVRGETTTCFAITERESGSDFLNMSTVARRDGADWVINGRKALITWAAFADVSVVLARTSEGFGPRSLTAFFVPRDTPGVDTSRINRTIMNDGVTGEIWLTDCRVPQANVLGELGQGFDLAMAFINWRRVCRGGMCAGLGRYLLDKTLSYVKERTTFGRPLSSRQFIQLSIADMYLDLEAAGAYSLHCLRQLDDLDIWRLRRLPEVAVRLISAVKVWNDESLYRLADRALQLHGGWGLVADTGIEQIFRVARNLRVPAGTDEIQRLTIAKTLGLVDKD